MPTLPNTFSHVVPQGMRVTGAAPQISTQHPVAFADCAQHAALLDALPANIALLDAAGSIVGVNEAWRKFGRENGLGTAGSGIGLNYFQICASVRGAEAAEAAQAAVGTRAVLDGSATSFALEYSCHSPQVRRWFRLMVALLNDAPARTAIMMHVDITPERERANELAQLSEQTRLRERILSKVLSSISDYVHAYGRDGRLLFVNQPLLDLWGLASEHAVGKNFRELGYPQDLADRLQRQLQHVFDTGENVSGDTEYTGIAGISAHYEYIFAPVFDAQGAVEFVVGSSRDVTDRWQAASLIARTEKHLRGVMDGLGPFMFVGLLSPDGIILEVNAAPLTQVGLQRSDVIGLPFASTPWWRGHDDARVQLLEVLELARNGVASRYDTRVMGAAGSLIDVDFSLQPLLDETGKVAYLVSSATVITERKDAERRIKHLNRGYIVISQINALIVRAANREELFREVCRIAVDAGGFRMAWIGTVDAASNSIRPLATAGGDIDEKIIGERLSLADDAPQGYGPSARAVREGQAIVVNDVATDAGILDGGAHAASGLLSLVSLPIVVAGKMIAVLGLHAGERDYFDEGEMTLLHVLAHDISFAIDHIEKAEKLAFLAFYDVLTGLANRYLFIERADQCLRSAAHAGHGAAMVLIDLDRFKGINDSLGQATGDSLLRQVTAWLQPNLVDSTLLGRVGADQFVAMFPHANAPSDAARQLERLNEGFHRHPFDLNGVPTRISAKFGVAMFPDDATDAATMFKRAESALKNAKSSGSRHLFYTQAMTDSVARTLGVESRLRRALDNGEFVLHYQSKVRATDGGLAGVEALLRWNDPDAGLVPPLDFISVLEETGLIIPVGRWILLKAIEDHARWREAGVPVRIAVNVSSLQLRAPDFVEDLSQMLGENAGAAAGLEIEITESLLMADIEHSIATLQAIRDIGVRVAIDDFGTGFSSLAYLARLPVDTLKIDRSFIAGMTQSPAGLSLVSTMIALAHSLALKVVAEGVEKEEEAKLLRLLRCDEMQGYLFAHPMPASVFESGFAAVIDAA